MTPAAVRLPERSTPEVDLESILSDPDRRYYFGALCSHYSMLLGSTDSDVRQLVELGEVVYLIDADVVRNVVETRYTNSRARSEAARLFSSPKFNYALPMGAAQELVQWLRSFTPEAIPWSSATAATGRITRTQVIRDLAHACNVPYDEKDSEAEISERIVSVVAVNSQIIERLIAFVSRDNFKGIVSDFDFGGVSELNRVLGQVPRHSKNTAVSRAEQDYRDAINLGIVFQSFKNRNKRPAKTDADDPCYILVTQTRAILDLVRTSYDSEYLLTLSTLLGVEGPVVEGVYPVFSPRRAFVVEEVRNRFGFDSKAVAGLRKERQVYDELSGILQRPEGGRSSVQRSSAELTRWERSTMEDCIGHLANIYLGEDDFFRSLERVRALDTSLEYLESQEQVDPADPESASKLQSLRDSVVSFFKRIAELHISINAVSPTTYEIRHDPDIPGVLDSITVYSRNPDGIAMQGELYYDAHSHKPSAYSFRWATSATDRQFFLALASIIRPDSSLRKNFSFQLRPITDESPEWQNGFIVFTSEGTYGASLDGISFRWISRDLSLHHIKTALAPFFSQGADDGGERPRITAIRLATPFGDFQLDIFPVEGLDREVFVVSHYNLADQISHLCDSTGLFATFPIKLSRALRKITSMFPQFPE